VTIIWLIVWLIVGKCDMTHPCDGEVMTHPYDGDDDAASAPDPATVTQVSHDLFVYVIWLIHMCDMMHSHVIWLIYDPATVTGVSHDSFVGVTCDVNPVTRMNESYHTCEWVMSHMWMSHVTHVCEPCHTCEWVMSNM